MPDITHFNLPTRKPGFSVKTAKDLLNLPVHEIEERDVKRNESEYVAPGNRLERKLQEIWEEVLKVKDIGTKDAFVHLGGNSLDAVTIASKIHKEFNVKVQLSEIFKLSTLEKLSCYIEEAVEDNFSPIMPLELREYYDVSYDQKRIWLVDQLEDEQGAYNVSDSYIFEDLNPEVLKETVHNLIKRHEILRTTFITVRGESKQKIHDYESFPFKLKIIDLREKRVEPEEDEIKELVNKEAFSPFDLAKGPLLRITLIHLKDNRYLFTFAMHHIICDRWSINTAMNDVLILYNACIEGRNNPLTPLRVQYKDFAVWQNLQLNKEKLKLYQSYWRSQFGGKIPVLNLRTDYPRPAEKSQNGDILWCQLDKKATEALRGISQKNEGSLFMTLLAAVYALLYYYSGQEDIIVGVPFAGRDHDLDNQIGLFLNMLALRVKFNSGESFESLLNKVKEVALSAYKNQMYPFDRLISDLNFERDLSRSPLFDISAQLYNLGIGGEGAMEMKGVSVRRYERGQVKCKYDILINFTERKDHIYSVFEYNSDLFKHETMSRMANRFQKLIDMIATDIAIPLFKLDFEEERALSGVRPIVRRRR
jgi:acyl carrier protein